MLELLRELTPEYIATAIVGLCTLGVIARNAIFGWREASMKIRASDANVGSMTTAVAMTWDRDQIERFLQTFEGIAESLEAISKAQGILSDQFQQNTQSKLDDLMELLAQTERTQRRR